jgi:hypothetical protein
MGKSTRNGLISASAILALMGAVPLLEGYSRLVVSKDWIRVSFVLALTVSAFALYSIKRINQKWYKIRKIWDLFGILVVSLLVVYIIFIDLLLGLPLVAAPFSMSDEIRMQVTVSGVYETKSRHAFNVNEFPVYWGDPLHLPKKTWKDTRVGDAFMLYGTKTYFGISVNDIIKISKD